MSASEAERLATNHLPPPDTTAAGIEDGDRHGATRPAAQRRPQIHVLPTAGLA